MYFRPMNSKRTLNKALYPLIKETAAECVGFAG